MGVCRYDFAGKVTGVFLDVPEDFAGVLVWGRTTS